ncbi:MAG: hypothetical protein HY880_05110 [Deltaproteobacteria bacterium]|nr:hypothetical protein [Deltaproteobacteria bacterium]
MSSMVINTNIASLVAQQNLQVTNSQLKISVQRLSSGYRVNSAADDAAGLARADQLRSQSRMIQAALRNVNDGTSALEVADKSAEKISELLTRMGELAASGSQGTLDTTTRSYYSDEYGTLANEIERIAQTVEFGGSKLMNGSVATLDLFIGFKNSTNDTLNINMAALTIGAASLNLGTAAAAVAHVTTSNTVADQALTDITTGVDGVFSFTDGNGAAQSVLVLAGATMDDLKTSIDALGAAVTTSITSDAGGNDMLNLTSTVAGTAGDITIGTNNTNLVFATSQASSDATYAAGFDSIAQALNAIDTISAALTTVNDARAIYGASTNRLSAALSNLQITFTNFQAAESRIRDVDFAVETASFTKNQIMIQSGVAVLAQANMLPQSVLSLLK